MKAVKNFLSAIQDLIIRVFPSVNNNGTYKYAFIVHPRAYSDITRKYAIFRYLPRFFSYIFTMYFWPVVLSKISGLKSQISNSSIDGYIITVPLTAKQMVENRSLALKRITQACVLAEKHGAKIIGLGGLTSSMSKGGIDLISKINTNITTGHAYTAYNVAENFFALAKFMELSKDLICVGIVGAAGSVGSTVAKILARAGYLNIILIDLERKGHLFAQLREEIKLLNPKTLLTTSHKINDIIFCDMIIAATNAPEAVIKSEDLKWGSIVIDDAQPSDVHQDVFERRDVLVVEAGVTYTPGINSHFNFGLKGKHDNFCCLAEVLILAANEWGEHYVINRPSLELVDEISKLGQKLNFGIANFQNFRESITNEKMMFVRNCIKNNGIQN